MKQPIHLSVIVTSYNYEKYIPTTLDSLLQQSLPVDEIVVVEDGSKDRSLEIVQSYAKRYANVKLYTHPNHENRGLAASVRLGIEQATGNYIAFCESDDYWEKDHVKYLHAYLQQHPEAHFVVNGIQVVNLSGNTEYNAYINQCEAFLKKHSETNIFPHLGQNYIPTFSAVCLHKDVLRTVDFQAPYPAWLDFWMWRQICLLQDVHFLPKAVTYWRKHNESYDATSTGVNFDRFIQASDQKLVSQHGLIPLLHLQHKAQKKNKSWSRKLRRLWHR